MLNTIHVVKIDSTVIHAGTTVVLDIILLEILILNAVMVCGLILLKLNVLGVISVLLLVLFLGPSPMLLSG